MVMVSHIHVRALEVGDFDFVRGLASGQPNFTVPPVYVLWLMLRIKGAVSLVAEHNSEGLLGYLIAVPIDGPKNSMFVWQLAASEGSNRSDATLAILMEFRRIVKEHLIESVLFSAVPGSSLFRTLRGYAQKVFSSAPTSLHSLPPVVNALESEFLLEINDFRHDIDTRSTTQ